MLTVDFLMKKIDLLLLKSLFPIHFDFNYCINKTEK